MAVDFTKLNASVKRAFGPPSGTITYTPDGGEAVSITGSLEGGDEHEERTPGAQYTLFIDLADVTPAEGATVTLASITGYVDGTYRVVNIRRDGSNGAYLDLQVIRA